MGADPQSGTEDAPYVSGAKTLQGMICLALDWCDGVLPHLPKDKMLPQLEQAERMRLVEKKSVGRWRLTYEGHRAQVKRQFSNLEFDGKVAWLRRWAAGPIELGHGADGVRWITIYAADEQAIERRSHSLDTCLELIAPAVREFCASEGRSCW